VLLDFAEVLWPIVPPDWQEIVVGYGSKQGFKACASVVVERNKSFTQISYEKCDKLYCYARDKASDDQLTVLGLYRPENEVGDDGERVLRYIEGDRIVTVGEMEHPFCTIYQGLCRTMPNRRANSVQPAQPHHHPSKMDWDGFDNDDPNLPVADGSLGAFKRLVDRGEWDDVDIAFQVLNEEAVKACLIAALNDKATEDADAPMQDDGDGGGGGDGDGDGDDMSAELTNDSHPRGRQRKRARHTADV